MSIFYAPDARSTGVLPEEESQHAVRVLRLKAGDEIEIVDGKGNYFRAVLTNANHKQCGFEIREAIADFGKRNYRLHIALAPTKNIDRFEWFVEKAVEIGIDEITPLICRFSERKVIKPERVEKIIVAAAKQSQKAYFPVLNPLCNFNDFIKNAVASQKFIAHCYESEKKPLQQVLKKSSDVIILIGPEGDFSVEEVQFATGNNYQPVSLGNSRLRTETAGIVACHTVALLNEKNFE